MTQSISARTYVDDTAPPAEPPRQSTNDAARIDERRHCRKCLWKALKTGTFFFILYFIIQSVLIWADNWSTRREISSLKMSPRFEQFLKAKNVELNLDIYQPYIVLQALSFVPWSPSCKTPSESLHYKFVCPVLKHIPYPTVIAVSFIDFDGNRKIGVNRWGDWSSLIGPAKETGLTAGQAYSWTLWHELGHQYQFNKDSTNSPWFDHRKTLLAGIYRETHADIFALVNMAQEPGMTQPAFEKLLAGIIGMRTYYASRNQMHVSHEYLQCLKLEEFLVKDDAIKLSQNLFEIALKRKVDGLCFSEPEEKAK